LALPTPLVATLTRPRAERAVAIASAMLPKPTALGRAATVIGTSVTRLTAVRSRRGSIA
jgi:hypothetical protein